MKLQLKQARSQYAQQQTVEPKKKKTYVPKTLNDLFLYMIVKQKKMCDGMCLTDVSPLPVAAHKRNLKRLCATYGYKLVLQEINYLLNYLSVPFGPQAIERGLQNE